MIITGIGSQQTPLAVCAAMTQTGYTLGAAGHTLRSGAADGADIAFELGWTQAKGPMEIYVPWQGFNGHNMWHDIPDAAFKMAEMFHPNWNNLKDGVKRLMARNSQQIMGHNINSACDVVICYTKDGLRGGGTGQALRIAEHLGIPIWDYGTSLMRTKDIYQSQLELFEFLNKTILPDELNINISDLTGLIEFWELNSNSIFQRRKETKKPLN